MMAASNGGVDCAKALIAAGADVKAKNGKGETALTVAKDHADNRGSVTIHA
jgi:ankyrin repeat protein